ncbi:alpha/beta hydrolase [Litorilinea aerophila]|uniref:Alpha/beta hydrolase n=1 Tax=Litorilinea aerophila TaxID=1204385 RepID=A0A540VME8_9CHLR|nr:alpha/beta hydrolase [Litorilinea aerophila]MCC9074649.1 alpha/beta hydrolase [Litorilinea aerophila]
MHPIRDPELAAGLAAFEQLVPGGINLDDIPAARRFLAEMNAAMAAEAPPIPGVVSRDEHAPGPAGAPDVMVRVYEPEDRPEILPALLWIHGGGYVLGSVEQDDLKAKSLALSLNCVVASVEYRLAPEHPFPAPLEDCYAALKWLAASADQLGVNPKRIAIGGASAGGGLAAGLGLLARDRGEVDVCYQLLIYPMLDDTNVKPAGPGTPDAPLWTRANNLIGWRSYLGQEPGSEGISTYAAPFRAQDVSGLPPTFVGVGTPDLFRDEDIAYAQRLMQAGVPTELHVYADGFHAFDLFAPESDAAQRFTAEYTRLLKRALHS